MAKYFFYGFILLVVLFALELFKVVDVPFLEIPDWLSGKEALLHRSTQELERAK